MHHNHITIGGDLFDGFLKALETLGINYHTEELNKSRAFTDGKALRRAIFQPDANRSKIVVEEHIVVDDPGVTRIAIEVYTAGKRPDLESRRKILQ